MRKRRPRRFVAFVCAPYTSPDLFTREANITIARAAAAKLWKLGYATICPQANSSHFDGITNEEDFYLGYEEILSRCDSIYVVSGWGASKGCRREVALAKELNITFINNLPGEEKPMKEVIIRCDLCRAVMKSKGSSSDLVVGAMIKDDVCEDCLLEFDKLLGEREDLGKDTPED